MKIGVWLIFATSLLIAIMFGWGMFRFETFYRAYENERDTRDQETEAYQAWAYVMDWDRLYIPYLVNSNQEPPDDRVLSRRDVWVKSYEKNDVKTSGFGQYKRPKYTVSSILGFNDRAPEYVLKAMMGKSKDSIVLSLTKGVWNYRSVSCEIERLDGPNTFFIDSCSFAPGVQPKYPAVKIKDGRQ